MRTKVHSDGLFLGPLFLAQTDKCWPLALLVRHQIILPPTLPGENTRNFLYVADVASAFDKILHQAVEGHIYNIGGSNEVSVLQVAKDLMK